MRILLEKRKSKCVIGVMLALLCPLICAVAGGSTKAGFILMAMVMVVAFLRLDIINHTVLTCAYVLCFILFPFLTFVLGQIMQSVTIFTVSPTRILINMGIFLTIQLIVLVVSARIRLSIIVGQFVPLIFMLANAYVLLFRGNALTPADFLSVQTAANVAAEYNFTPTATMVYALMLAMISVLFLFCLPELQIKRNRYDLTIQLAIAFMCVVWTVFGSTQFQSKHWANNGSTYNGFVFNFILQLKEAFVAEPKGYSNDVIEMLESGYSEGSDNSTSTPDIIVIMDESFADLDVFGNDLCTNAEVTPFVDSLQENTVRGYLYASVFGGSTANSEYEFLSGNTMAFLPWGSIVYQQFFSEDAYSLVSVLKEKGYDCAAMHPYFANGWLRESVYPAMGFDDTRFLEDFPQEQLVREYVSDQEMFEYIIDYHEKHDEDTPLFLFGVTMQNHGGYTYEGPNYESTIKLEGYTRDYPETEQYLSLIHETDKAVQYLIEYFESINRDVVIAFFGDHMPQIENEFYEELNGSAFDTLDEQMRKQMVPFFVWTNYDSEEREVPCSSINYLPIYVLEAAGISLPPYFQFLKQTESVIPAINAYGYYSQEHDGFLTIEEASGAEAEAIKAYELLQYNNIFDDENCSAVFFEP